MKISYQRLKRAFEQRTLFENKTWKLSPEAFPLSPRQVEDIREIGSACREFYRVSELLYLRSAEGRNLLRNRQLKAPWVSEYLDRGKPPDLIAHSRSSRVRGECPRFIRPDLIITESGYALTEIDAVPGGIGLTAFLNRIYEESGEEVVGAGDRMPDAFYSSLAQLVPDRNLPLIAILVSDESQTYRPEMDWLAECLREKGKRIYCVHPRDVMPLGGTLCVSIDGNPEQIDVVYRFWELFDMENVPVSAYLMEAWEEAELAVTPPMRHFQEEKLNLALFHHHLLEDFWRENLSRGALRWLRRIIPNSWIMDAVDLPPNAVLDAPEVGGRPIWQWEQLGHASKKERNLIIKLSGYHEGAQGARSVVLGSDSAKSEWQASIDRAIRQSGDSLSILQDYHKPRRLTHPVYVENGADKSTPDIVEMQGRVRLTPYYAIDGEQVELTGILSTFCPADKKIIHGMRDAAMLPCRIER